MADPFTPYSRRALAWIDYGERERLTQLTCRPDTGANATMGAAHACSNADILAWWEGPVIPVSGEEPIANQLWYNVGSVLTLELVGSEGNKSRIFIPAPVTTSVTPRGTLLQSDRQTLDMSSPSLATLSTIMSSELRIPLTGEAFASIDAGWVTHSYSQERETFAIGGGEDLYRRCVEWRDTAGRRYLTLLTSSAGAPLTQNGIEATSCAVVNSFWEGLIVPTATPATTPTPYGSVADEARLVFADMGGAKTTVVIPAPSRDIFMDDGKTIDTNEFLIIELIAAALFELIVPSTARPVTNYVSGYYQSNRLYRQ